MHSDWRTTLLRETLDVRYTVLVQTLLKIDICEVATVNPHLAVMSM